MHQLGRGKKYKNKLQLWKHKQSGEVMVELEASLEHSHPTEEEVENEGGNIQDKNGCLKPEIELSKHVSTITEPLRQLLCICRLLAADDSPLKVEGPPSLR